MTATPRPVVEDPTSPNTQLTCDGCGKTIETFDRKLLHPIPDDILGMVYGRPPGYMKYIVCRPLPEGYDCLYRAIVSDVEHYNAHPCNAVEGLICFCQPTDPSAHLAAIRRVTERRGKLL